MTGRKYLLVPVPPFSYIQLQWYILQSTQKGKCRADQLNWQQLSTIRHYVPDSHRH
ncbi:similar to ring finger protein 122 homolog (predicted) [Rattus norvegicus]|uniref:Similar to ring finger protein 122 homolog (Predicted) n=1 Tax=Rattus norvegicus TaxID=10116 RepID=A6IVW1_RAT|nr:similar to ring finger protein 122 homolog (predicted) [Rattus norvegicus]